MEKWFAEYCKRNLISIKFPVNWSALLAHFEDEKSLIIEAISRIGKDKLHLGEMIKEAVIKEHDHGLFSSFLVTRILRNKVEEMILETVSSSIAMHGDEFYKKFSRIKGDDLPFGFLLVFCDEVQQWGRPQMISMIEKFKVKLKDIILEKIGKTEKVIISLEYSAQLTDEIKTLVINRLIDLVSGWIAPKDLIFSIKLFLEGEEDSFFDLGSSSL